MKCDKCGSPNVVTKIVIQGEKEAEELNLCASCFQQFIKDHPEIKQGQMGKSLNEFLLGTLNLFNSELKKGHTPDHISHETVIKTCSSCGMTASRLKKFNRVGCSDCYSVFEDEIDNYLMKEIGENTKTLHYLDQTNEQRLEELNVKMENAVKEEDYELAAMLRDEIKKLTINN